MNEKQNSKTLGKKKRIFRIGVGKEFLNLILKAQTIEIKIDNWTSEKLKILALKKTMLIRWEK